MTNFTEDPIMDATTDRVPDVAGDYELEIYLSTDGKHTVHGKATTTAGKERMFKAITRTYDEIVVRYGTKQAQAKREYGVTPPPNAEVKTCENCGATAIERSGEKNGKKWHAIFCSTEDKTHTKWLR